MSVTPDIGVVEQSTETSNVSENNIHVIIEEKNRLIICERAKSDSLEKTLFEKNAEIDALRCQLSKLQFELEIADLKRLNDEW